MTNTVEYQGACESLNKYARQNFLDSLDLEDTKPYIKKVIYDPIDHTFMAKDGSRVNPHRVHMMTEYSFWTKMGFKHGKSVIRVFKASFNGHNYACLEDFLSTLIDHEGFHAKEHYEDPKSIAGTEERTLESEIKAVENQLKIIESGKRECSEDYIKKIQEIIRTHREQWKYC